MSDAEDDKRIMDKAQDIISRYLNGKGVEVKEIEETIEQMRPIIRRGQSVFNVPFAWKDLQYILRARKGLTKIG